MTAIQATLLGILAVTIGLFLWGRWRHDIVALGALLACVFAGLVPAADAFAGFSHPAVITVACVLVLSRGLQTSGAIDAVTRVVLPWAGRPHAAVVILTVVAALLSAFMNNVGALALLIPVAMQIASRQATPPGRLLMPLAFGSILGGMTTLIGTPPNLIVSAFRADQGSGAFAMFDFAPVGLAVAACGIGFIVIVGWRLVPARRRVGAEEFDTGAYLTEARVPDTGKAVGMTLYQIERALGDSDAQVVGLVRNDLHLPGPRPWYTVRSGDILVIEADPKGLPAALATLDLKLEEAVTRPSGPPAKSNAESAENEAAATMPDEKEKEGQPKEAKPAARSDEVALMEVVVLPDSPLVGCSATDMRLRTRFGINLLAISRQGRRSIARLRITPVFAGDVLLVQGSPDGIAEFASARGCVPLAERTLRLPDKRQAATAVVIMALAIAIAALNLAPAAVAFAAGVVASLLLRVVSPRTVYSAVDWPVIVLLGALIPVAGAMATTGVADLIASLLLAPPIQREPVIALAVILVATMTLSDFMNNAATAAVMCPIAISTATSLAVSTDPFLMAVAGGASCAFLTPIGHQNNTLILGPGGFRFGDYWRLGLPLEVIVVTVGVPMLLLVWPL